MTTWEGIEDPSNHPERIWFARVKDDNPWEPLRKCDCQQINATVQAGTENTTLIEFGRATVDLQTKRIRYNFYNAPVRQLCCALWFVRDCKNGSGDKDVNLVPICSTMDEMLIEEFYIQCKTDQNSSGGSIDAVNLNVNVNTAGAGAEVILQDDHGYKVILMKVGNTLSLRKKSVSIRSLLQGSTELQRGYGDYTVEGEKEELALGPVRHLSFIIHGVGEAMWRREDVMLPGVIENVEEMRATINKTMYASWEQQSQLCQKRSQTIPPPPNRIEFIPVEWYDKIHSSSSSLKNNLLSTTLGTIPRLRSIANDVIFDVLMYLTPEFCEEVLNCVTEQIIDCYHSFQTIHKDFSTEGSVSLLGHSLGSVITWDILSLLGDRLEQKVPMTGGSGTHINPIVIDDEVKGYKLPTDASHQSADVYRAYAGDSGVEVTQKGGTWGPCTVRKVAKTIPFIPKFTMFLGSPLGLFLTLRGARRVFDELRLLEEKDTVVGRDVDATLQPSSPFTLPSGAVYNIFHPSDPVAYRIEPVLLPKDFKDSDLPKPCFLTVAGQGLRLHVQAKELGDTIYNTFSGLLSSKLLEKMPSQRSMMDAKTEMTKETKATKTTKTSNKFFKGKTIFDFDLGGTSERVDFQLQPGVVDNEYLSAVSAHSTYWSNGDFMNFLIECANST